MEPFTPPHLPNKNLDWIRFIPLLGKVNAEVARYDGLLRAIPNPSVLLSPLTTQEAVLSSKIEGTQATLQEVLQFEAAPEELSNNKAREVKEVLNYRRAMHTAIQQMGLVGFSLRMIREVHSVLLENVRGYNTNTGDFRTMQNWIGKLGTGIGEATYIPPTPEKVLDLLSNWEQYINSFEMDVFVQLALVHAQFELIHPFLDGNGRVGRIILPLFLYHKGIIHSPVFYLSAYFESHREEYYERLGAISRENKWNEWVEYFLEAVLAQARINSEKAKAIHQLHQDTQRRLKLLNSQYSIQIVELLFEFPVFSSSQFIQGTNMTRITAGRVLGKLQAEGLITKIIESKGRKPAVFIFVKLLAIVD